MYFDALSMLPEEPEEAAGVTQTAHNSFAPGTTKPPSATHGLMSPKGHRALDTPSICLLRPQYAAHVAPHQRALDQAALSALRSAINMSSAYEEDYVHLAEVGDKLPRMSPDLIPRNYGFERLRDFVEASGIVELWMKSMGPNPPVALVRLKGPSTPNVK